MKLVYLSNACPDDEVRAFCDRYHMNRVFVQQKWDWEMAKGLYANLGDDMTCISLQPVSMFPTTKCIRLKRRVLKTDSGVVTMPGCLNLPVLKQLALKRAFARELKKWYRKNRGEQLAIVTSCVIPQIVEPAFRLRKKTKVGVYTLVPDLPQLGQDPVLNGHRILRWMNAFYVKRAVRDGQMYDGYACFSKYQMEYLNQDKPYIVLEGVIDARTVQQIAPIFPDSDKKVIIYAGQLLPQYGVDMLIDAFQDERLSDFELQLYGNGPCGKRAEEMKRSNIRYMGVCEKTEMLAREKGAWLLINPRPTEEAFSKCSFPSKLLEYMATGTPVLTSRLLSIGDEYADKMYYLDAVSTDGIIRGILSVNQTDDGQMGTLAQAFVQKEKNAAAQGKRLIRFVLEQNAI